MSRFVTIAKKLVRREAGATMIEYGLLASLVSIAALVALQALGPKLLTIFNTVSAAL